MVCLFSPAFAEKADFIPCEAEPRDRFSCALDPEIEAYYCALSPVERAAYINALIRKMDVIYAKKRPLNYNLQADRKQKKTIEQAFVYNPDFYPEQETAYKLGVLHSGLSCEIVDYKISSQYFAKAGRKPESYLGAGIAAYKHNPTSEYRMTYIKRAINHFEIAARLGLEQGYKNAIYLLETYFQDEQKIRLARLKKQYARFKNIQKIENQ
ncbi:MAG: hypothetical protein AAF621_01730 [Pseudomonadota bacterium]